MKRLLKIFGILIILAILLALPIAVLAAPVGKVSSVEGTWMSEPALRRRRSRSAMRFT